MKVRYGDEGRKVSKKFWTKALEVVRAVLSKKYMGAMTEAKEKTKRRGYQYKIYKAKKM
jgi:hypothetical protein